MLASSNGATRPAGAMNHVFVDFENVPHIDLSTLGDGRPWTLTLLLGPKQTRLDAVLVEQLLQHASTVQLVRLTHDGKNALDFTLAYYLGRAVLADPAAYFHIVSKDKGFDPLIEHLRSRQIHARRHADFSTVTFGAPASSKTGSCPPAAESPQDDPFLRVVEHLKKNVTNRPKRMTTLTRHLQAVAGKGVPEKQISDWIERLRKTGLLSVSDKGAVAYRG